MQYGKCAKNLKFVEFGRIVDPHVPTSTQTCTDASQVSKVIDRVICIQRSYSDEIVSRCHLHSSNHDGKQIPARFDDSTLPCGNPAKRLLDQDIRIVNQDIIDMTSKSTCPRDRVHTATDSLSDKFYALTEPVKRSILSSDLSAEFPFEISKEEARVISHVQTASLILGRSGTGKTTCLVYKLVTKYLVSKAVLDENPVRQVSYRVSAWWVDRLTGSRCSSHDLAF